MSDLTRIAGNVAALNTLNSLNQINSKMALHQSRLATGKRINSAADDPAGLTIATKMKARSEGLKVAQSNIGDAQNLLAVAESGLGRINDILVQMRNKAEAGATDTIGVKERKALVTQMEAYAAQIDDIVDQTKWNDNKLIDGTYGNVGSQELTFQTGADKGDVTMLSGLDNMSASDANGLNIATQSAAAYAGSEQQDIYNILAGASSVSAGAGSNANLTELASGRYDVKVTYGATKGDAISIQLFEEGGTSAIYVNDGSGGEATTYTSAAAAVDGSGTTPTIDLGNGLSVTIQGVDAGDANLGQTRTATISFTQGGGADYALNNSGVALDENSTASEFADYMDLLNNKLDTVSEQLSSIGSLSGRLTFKSEQVATAQINVEASYNRIMNADMAAEQVEASKYQILQQTSVSMLAQSNSAPQFLLSLFR